MLLFQFAIRTDVSLQFHVGLLREEFIGQDLIAIGEVLFVHVFLFHDLRYFHEFRLFLRHLFLQAGEFDQFILVRRCQRGAFVFQF